MALGRLKKNGSSSVDAAPTSQPTSIADASASCQTMSAERRLQIPFITLQHLFPQVVPNVAVDLMEARFGFDVDEISRSRESMGYRPTSLAPGGRRTAGRLRRKAAIASSRSCVTKHDRDMPEPAHRPRNQHSPGGDPRVPHGEARGAHSGGRHGSRDDPAQTQGQCPRYGPRILKKTAGVRRTLFFTFSSMVIRRGPPHGSTSHLDDVVRPERRERLILPSPMQIQDRVSTSRAPAGVQVSAGDGAGRTASIR